MKIGTCFLLKNERGAALIVGLLLVLVLTILSLGAMMSTATELKIASNDRLSKQVFYAAEAGLEDARSRFQPGASASPIPDQSTNPDWKAFVGTRERAIQKGFADGNSNFARYDQLNTYMDYVATVEHKLNASRQILKWGDSNGDGILEENTTIGTNIYVIKSDGYSPDGAWKPLAIEVTNAPPIPVPAALYTKSHTTIQGTSTSVLGMDHCGSNNLPGIVTMDDIRLNGTPPPTITGAPSAIVQYSTNNIDVQRLINENKKRANYSYDVRSSTMSGMDWGTPVPGVTQQDASSCSTRNVVSINTNYTYVTIKGQSHGCGMLLVEGDLYVEGGFQWYGIVLVTGAITFTGGGGKNVTGAMLAGDTVDADLVGGDGNLIYCSSAVNDQTNNLPLITLRWAELFS